MAYERFLRPVLFKTDPEWIHQATLRMLAMAGAWKPMRAVLQRLYCVDDAALQVNLWGLTFPNPIGLAAGYDKDGQGMHGLACLGFGHLELGTVTPLPQDGNPRPRIFRLPEDRAVVNRMGFPNRGGDALRTRLQLRVPKGVILGVNIGKGVQTHLECAAEDYLGLMEVFYPLADYLVVNVSSPNTVGLRRLQVREALDDLLHNLAGLRSKLQDQYQKAVPLLIKLAPDLQSDELKDAVEIVLKNGIDGVIATNTTISREGLRSRSGKEAGGLSGAPLKARSTEIIHLIHKFTDGNLPIIAVGGVFDLADVLEKFEAGASLVQLYTGLVYRGPGLVREILEGLHSRNTQLL
ncbi:MAG TPA: quinone-dependent dihydroorotate dehydrogenase [Anaerolineales bacterium]|nr:quinone-dependent dihydroorotate dehydrogenase [Anaerolineales bacterium]